MNAYKPGTIVRRDDDIYGKILEGIETVERCGFLGLSKRKIVAMPPEGKVALMFMGSSGGLKEKNNSWAVYPIEYITERFVVVEDCRAEISRLERELVVLTNKSDAESAIRAKRLQH